MRAAIAALAATGLAGCPAPAPAPAPPATAPAAPAPAPARTGFRVLHPTLRDRPDAVHLELIARGGSSARFAPDGETMLILHGRGGKLVTGAHSRSLPHRPIVTASFSPDGRYLALLEEGHRLRVVATDAAANVSLVGGAARPRWTNAGELTYLRGCDVMRLRPGMPPRVLFHAPQPCGDFAGASRDGRHMWLALRGHGRRNAMQTYRSLKAIDLTRGRAYEILSATADAPFMAPVAAGSGDRVCWIDASFALYCRSGARTERVAANASGPLQLDPTGRWLLYTIGDRHRPDAQIGVVDFRRREIRILPARGREWWTMIDGGRRIGGHGGHSSAIFYDLANGWRTDLGDPGSEWEGMWADPAQPTRFALGRERRGTRDLYLATVSP